jgi:hypothetical protein
MAQPVPIHADKPELLARRLELTIREIVPVECATLASCENETFWIRDGWLTLRQNLNGLVDNRRGPELTLVIAVRTRNSDWWAKGANIWNPCITERCTGQRN